MKKSGTHWLPVLVLAIGIAGAVGIFWNKSRHTPAKPDASVAEPAPARSEVREPLYPIIPPQKLPRQDQRQLVALPPLDDSDAYFRLALIDLFGARLDELLAEEAVIEKFVTTVDNLPRSRVAERIRPVKPPPGVFVVAPGNGEDVFVLSPENFERYGFLIHMLENADPDALVDTYRRFYPLLQEAYVALGYPDGYFNDRLVEVIDHLVETPGFEQGIRLKRTHVLYEYADPNLEALSSGRKLLLRIGPEHAERTKEALRQIRTRLVEPGAGYSE